MFKTSTEPSYSSLMNRSITNDPLQRTQYQTISNPFTVTKNYYLVSPYLHSEFAPSEFRDTVVKRQLGKSSDDYMTTLYIPSDEPIAPISDHDSIFAPISENPATSELDQLFFELNRPVIDYPIEETLYNQPRSLLPDPEDEFNYNSSVLTHKSLSDTSIAAQDILRNNIRIDSPPNNPTASPIIKRNGIITDSVPISPSKNPSQTHIPPRSIPTSKPELISSPTLDYTLFSTINERFVDSSLNLNKSVPINFQTSSASPSRTFESFSNNLSGYFSSESLHSDYNNSNETFSTPISETSNETFSDSLPYLSEAFKYKDPVDAKAAPFAISSYLNTLRARAMATCFYLQENKSYSKWSSNWKFLHANLYDKNKLLFQKLDESDADIAYVISKGVEVKFRIRDEKRFIPINIYQYVLYHEMAHMSTHELQHTKGFFDLLAIISLAAFEMGFIDLKRMSTSYFNTNGAPILCRVSMKSELCHGCDMLIDANPSAKDYYTSLKEYVEKQ